jgi:hypothetical protein
MLIVSGKHPTWVLFEDLTSKNFSLFWLNYKGRRVFYQDLAPHASWLEQTFATNPWVATLFHHTSRGIQNRCVEIFVATRRSARADVR